MTSAVRVPWVVVMVRVPWVPASVRVPVVVVSASVPGVVVRVSTGVGTGLPLGMVLTTSQAVARVLTTDARVFQVVALAEAA